MPSKKWTRVRYFTLHYRLVLKVPASLMVTATLKSLFPNRTPKDPTTSAVGESTQAAGMIIEASDSPRPSSPSSPAAAVARNEQMAAIQNAKTARSKTPPRSSKSPPRPSTQPPRVSQSPVTGLVLRLTLIRTPCLAIEPPSQLQTLYSVLIHL